MSTVADCCDPQAGDALFIPAGWWHQVDSSAQTIAVNYWFATPKTTSLTPAPHTAFFAARQALLQLVDERKDAQRRGIRAHAAALAAEAADPTALAQQLLRRSFESAEAEVPPLDALALAGLTQQGVMSALCEVSDDASTRDRLRHWLLHGMSAEAAEVLTCALEGDASGSEAAEPAHKVSLTEFFHKVYGLVPEGALLQALTARKEAFARACLNTGVLPFVT